jgi:hypothetical protein
MTNASDDQAPFDTPSSGSFTDPSTGSGTAAGDPLAGVGTPEDKPVYPDGADEALEG